jgi:hypothetical protein
MNTNLVAKILATVGMVGAGLVTGGIIPTGFAVVAAALTGAATLWHDKPGSPKGGAAVLLFLIAFLADGCGGEQANYAREKSAITVSDSPTLALLGKNRVSTIGKGISRVDALWSVPTCYPDNGDVLFFEASLNGQASPTTPGQWVRAGNKCYRLQAPSQTTFYTTFIQLQGDSSMTTSVPATPGDVINVNIWVEPSGTVYLAHVTVDNWTNGQSASALFNPGWPVSTWKGLSGWLGVEKLSTKVPLFDSFTGDVWFTESTWAGDVYPTDPTWGGGFQTRMKPVSTVLVDETTYCGPNCGSTWNWQAGQ